MTAIILHQSMHPTTWLAAQMSCTWSKNRKLHIVHLRTWGESAWEVMLRTGCYGHLQLVHGFLCSKLPAQSAEIRWTYVIHHPNEVDSDGPESEMSRSSWIQMIIPTNSRLGAKNHCMDFTYNCWAPIDCYYVSEVSWKVSVNRVSTIFRIASWKTQMVLVQHPFIIEL